MNYLILKQYLGFKKNLKSRRLLFVYPYLKSLVGNQFNLSYHGRIQRAAPAEGDGEIHKLVQNQIIESSIENN